jgi:hypothetical protein
MQARLTAQRSSISRRLHGRTGPRCFTRVSTMGARLSMVLQSRNLTSTSTLKSFLAYTLSAGIIYAIGGRLEFLTAGAGHEHTSSVETLNINSASPSWISMANMSVARYAPAVAVSSFGRKSFSIGLRVSRLRRACLYRADLRVRWSFEWRSSQHL